MRMIFIFDPRYTHQKGTLKIFEVYVWVGFISQQLYLTKKLIID